MHNVEKRPNNTLKILCWSHYARFLKYVCSFFDIMVRWKGLIHSLTFVPRCLVIIKKKSNDNNRLLLSSTFLINDNIVKYYSKPDASGESAHFSEYFI